MLRSLVARLGEQRIVIAMSGEVVIRALGETVAVAEMMLRYPVGR